LEDGADIGGEACGKLRHTILADFNSDKFMSAVRVSALMCISYNISISVCGSFYAASAPMMNISAICSPNVAQGAGLRQLGGRESAYGCRRKRPLLLLSDGCEAKVTARSMRCEVGMIHIRAHAQGNVLVKHMLAAAFKTMVKATRNHVGEILSSGSFAVESITEDRKRPGWMPMTSMTCRAVVRTRPRSQQARLSAALRHSVRNS